MLEMNVCARRSAVQGSSLPEDICGKDERVQVQPMTSPPYKWICFLLIESASGEEYVGSGFKIHLPDVNYTAIVTSGHCTFVDGEYAPKITVQFPGEKKIVVGRDDIYASPEYISSGSRDHDYGLILLPGTSNYGFGWSAIVADDELNNRLVTNCGYPVDKPEGTMWITGGNITSYTANRLFYMNDTVGGQSGSPVYTWYGGYWTVLAVHSYGGCPNSAPRFTIEMISRFLQRMNGLTKTVLRSVAFPDVFLRCDGKDVTKFEGPGSGTVNCQYSPAKSLEHFYIYPVEVTPSLALESTRKVVIESAQFKNVFIRMNSKGMSKFDGPGGGEVNCQFTAHGWEVFFLKRVEYDRYSFRSAQFLHCYIRLDGKGVDSWQSGGGGTVNCQWYASDTSPGTGSYEFFFLD